MSTLQLYDLTLNSRLLLGTARYASPSILQAAIKASQTEMVTVSLRRQQANPSSGADFWALLNELNVHILPNTAGCETVQEAVTLAHMSRELFQTDFIKLEIIGDALTLQPDMSQTLDAAKKLLKDGFKVLPYCTDDLVACLKLVDAGCEVIMPWGSPIGSGRGLSNPYQLEVLRARLPNTTLVIDAGIGRPSHAVSAFELGYDAILLNTAVAKAIDPVAMATAFNKAADAGRLSYEAVPMIAQDIATPSTPIIGMPFRNPR